MRNREIACLVACILVIAVLIPLLSSTGVTATATEIIELRTRNSKTFDLGNQQYALDVSLRSIHYQDEYGDWQEIDTTIVESARPNWDWEVVKGHWTLLIAEDTTVAIGKDGHWIGFRYEGVGYLDWSTKNYVILFNRQNVTPTVEANRIQWAGIFPGCNLEYVYTNDGFKENLEVTQNARDWLVTHPPSSYGLDNSSTYIGGFLECDWQSSYSAEDAGGNPINWDNANEFIDSGVFWRHPVKDKIVTALPLGYAIHDAVQPENWVQLRYRFYEQGGTHYVLFGASVLGLNSYPSGTINFDPSVDEQVGASGDDYRRYSTDGFSSTDGVPYIGWYNAQHRHGGARFTSVNVPQAATIDVAYLSFQNWDAGTGSNPSKLRIYGNDVDDAVAPTSEAEFDALALTDANVDWDNYHQELDTWYNSDSIVSIVQEIVDRGGWAANNDMQIIWKSRTPVESNWQRIRNYDSSTTTCPKLHIEYSTEAAVGRSWGTIIG